MSRTPAAFVLIAALTGAATSGCRVGQVKDLFSVEVSCPSSRVTVTEDPEPPLETIDEPPPEIAADPERAALYYETRRATRTQHRRRMFTVEGCGETHTYTCVYASRCRRSG